MPAKRQRKQFKFWLNVLNPQEKYLADVIQWLTEQGEFVRSIRDGLRLIYDLRFQKDTQSLMELFPDIRERLQVSSAPVSGGAGGQSDLLEIKSMLELVVAQQSSGGYLMKSAGGSTQPQPTTGKQLAGFKALAAPVADDFDDMPALDIQRDESAGGTLNFLSMAKGLHAAPPKAEIKKAAPVSADTIADNFLNAFS